MRLIYFTIVTLASICLRMSCAQAYPEFIGYGYSSCLNCHYNGMGGGPLTDYGRALWASELASRSFYSGSVSDDDLAASSGFAGKKELPFWLRPHAKYRGLDLRLQPGSSSQDTTKYYHMQSDVGLALQDSSSRIVALLTYGRVASASQYGIGGSTFDRWLAREYYVRARLGTTWWVYLGLLEKVFGIRNIDHTSFQRTYQGFNVANNDVDGIAQSQGVILHKIAEHWEVALNYFIGNPYDDQVAKQTGSSALGEFDVGENRRLGISVLSASSSLLTKQMAAIHFRQKVSQGSALMLEYGLIQDQNQTGKTYLGSYNLLQALVLLTRGYNLKLTAERYNKEFNDAQPELWKWSAGFLIFPLQRFEFRFEAVEQRALSAQNTGDDTWALEGQIHVSL